jgi:hypothetical protein
VKTLHPGREGEKVRSLWGSEVSIRVTPLTASSVFVEDFVDFLEKIGCCCGGGGTPPALSFVVELNSDKPHSLSCLRRVKTWLKKRAEVEKFTAGPVVDLTLDDAFEPSGSD